MPVTALPQVRRDTSALEGQAYSVANGKPIFNEGQKTVRGTVGDGTKAVMTFQLTEVHKPLASVGRMTEAGNIVHFDEYGPDGSYIEDRRTGRRTKLYKKNGVFVFPFDVDVGACASEQRNDGQRGAGFQGPPCA